VRDSEHTPGCRPARRRATLAVIGACGALGLLASACSGSPAGTAKHRSHAGTTSVAGAAARVSITPANRSTHAKPNRGVSVTVSSGKIESVRVAGGGGSDPGALGSGGTSWHTRWPLHPATRYTVTVTARGTDGKTATSTSSFRTLTPAQTFTASTILGDESYGVGMPIMIDFSQPVRPKFRAAIEQAIEIKSSKPVVGAWYWDNSCGSAQCLYFRTRNYWPQHTNVSFHAHFNGAAVAPGVYGTADLSQAFHIGASLIGITNTVTHHTTIYYKRKLFGIWPDSSGMPGDDTADGTYLTIEKANPTLMTGPGYTNVPVYYSVRFTWSGNYYHYAPWSVGEQGYINVSHGCVNLNYPDSTWYYYHAVPGDPITVVGSPVRGGWDDGYTEWFLSWKQLLRGSATHEAVEVGPAGSTFVNPDTLPATSDSRVNGSKPYNYLAGAP
jgi:lipoprotein-anchoring transpeptidase ErfK/SrfK